MTGGDRTEFETARKRLDEIMEQVRSKDLSLEKSLDLYEEAIKLGARCSSLVDNTALSEEERVTMADSLAGQSAKPAADEGDPDVAAQDPGAGDEAEPAVDDETSGRPVEGARSVESADEGVE